MNHAASLTTGRAQSPAAFLSWAFVGIYTLLAGVTIALEKAQVGGSSLIDLWVLVAALATSSVWLGRGRRVLHAVDHARPGDLRVDGLSVDTKPVRAGAVQGHLPGARRGARASPLSHRLRQRRGAPRSPARVRSRETSAGQVVRVCRRTGAGLIRRQRPREGRPAPRTGERSDRGDRSGGPPGGGRR